MEVRSSGFYLAMSSPLLLNEHHGGLMKFKHFQLFLAIFFVLFSLNVFAAGVEQIRYVGQQVITNGSMASTSINSTAFDLDQFIGYSCQAVWTGASAAGTLKLQISDDLVTDCSAISNWIDYTNSSYTVSGAGSYLWNASQANYRCVRAVYTKSSGTGTLNVVCGSKK